MRQPSDELAAVEDIIPLCTEFILIKTLADVCQESIRNKIVRESDFNQKFLYKSLRLETI